MPKTIAKNRFNSSTLYCLDGMSLNVIDEACKVLLREKHLGRDERRQLHRIIDSQLACVEFIPPDPSMGELRRQVAKLETAILALAKLNGVDTGEEKQDVTLQQPRTE